MRMADQIRLVLPLLMKHLKPALTQGRPEVERDIDAMMPHLLEIVDKRSAELIEATVPVYVRHCHR